jgi:predicted transcriptional regulator
MTAFKMTPEQYRERWGLPADYPMVAPNYAKTRSRLAKDIGLGTSREAQKGKK